MLLALPAAAAPAYEALVELAAARDGELAALALEEERAAIAAERSGLARDRPRLAAESGSAVGYLSASGPGFYASPQATLTLPNGISLGAAAPMGLGVLGGYVDPGLSVGLPLVRGPDEALVAVEKARAALEAARAARARRGVALEQELVSALKAACAADIEAQAAAGAEAKSRRELERARLVDGAEPGGLAYRRAERELRSKARASRDAEASRASALEALAAIVGPEAAGVPGRFPETDLRAALPDPERCLDVALARSEARAGSIAAAEAARRCRVDGSLGASYSTAGGEDASGDAVYAGAGLSAGVVAALGDLELSVRLGYGKVPSLGLSASWKPSPSRDRELRDRDEELALALARAKVDEALRAARRKVAALESERSRLASQAEDAEWELRFAEDQAAAYEGWRAAGLVGDDEYAEALAAARECAARAKAAALDRMLWALEARALAGGAERREGR